MPKKKTNRGVAKRIKVTGKGNLMRRKGGTSHLLGKKKSKRKRKLRKDVPVHKSFKSKIKDLLSS